MPAAIECGTSEIIKIPGPPFQKTAFIKAEGGGGGGGNGSMHVRMKVDFGHDSASASHSELQILTLRENRTWEQKRLR